MVGLDKIKEQMLGLKDKLELRISQGVELKEDRLSASFLGNPGTGKTTVARLYAKFLASIGALPGGSFKECTGSSLSFDGIPGCKKIIEEVLNGGGGAIFIDEAYQLTSGNHPGGKAVLDFLLAEIENLRGKVVFIVAGYSKQMETFFQHNSGLPSRFPEEFKFQDYSDPELLQILGYGINRRYSGGLRLEDGPQGLFARIVSRRIGRSRGREGFGNAREVENAIARVAGRQATRIGTERRAGNQPDPMFLLKRT